MGGGGHWTLTRHISQGPHANTLKMQVQLQCDKARAVVHVPWLTIFPGLDNFGTSKTQGLLAGVEYLGDEPSSSEKDVRGAGANRLVPAPHKITFPLMALSHKGRTLGVMWELSDKIAAVHDSPDRVFGGKEHLMALWGPGVGAAAPGEPALRRRTVCHRPGRDG